jgi:hypothetical protein
LRSVAPKSDCVDKATHRRIRAFKTGDIYRGAMSFVTLQLIKVAAPIWKPQIVLYALGAVKVWTVDKVNLNITPQEETDALAPGFGGASGAPKK